MSEQSMPWPEGTYLKHGDHGGNSTLRFDPKIHDGAELLAEGWTSYDSSAPGTDACTDTHAWVTTESCPHVESWWCPSAPRGYWYPLALAPQWRDVDYTVTHRAEFDAFNAANPNKTGGPLAIDEERLARFKEERAAGKTWREIFAAEDGLTKGGT